MKKTFKTLAAALLLASAFTASFTACQDKTVAEPQTPAEDGDVYTIVLSGASATRAEGAAMEIGIREDTNQDNFTATLLKNNNPVDNDGITWSWERSTGGDYFNASQNADYPYECDIVGTSVSSGEGVYATAVYNGHTIVSQLATVTVIDDALNRIELDIADEMYVGNSEHYTVTAYYNVGTSEDVTSEADITVDPGTTKLELRNDGGYAVTAGKDADSCLGDATVSAAYGDKTCSKTVKVISDFKSTSLTCQINNGTEAGGGVSGNGNSDISCSVPQNNGGYVTMTLTGSLETVGGISYDIYSSSYIKVWYENSLFTGKGTYYMMPGDVLTMSIIYLGETVKSWKTIF